MDLEQEYATIESLRNSIRASSRSIGSERVKFILHDVPQINLDVIKRSRERGELLSKQYVATVFVNIQSEIEKITTFYWRLVGLLIAVPAALVAIGIIVRGVERSPTSPLPKSGRDTTAETPPVPPIVSLVPHASPVAIATPTATTTPPAPSPITAPSVTRSTVAETSPVIPTPLATPSATPPPTPSPTPIATPITIPTATAPSSSPASAISKSKSAPADHARPESSPPINLSNVEAIVQTVNRTQRGFSLSVSLKNVTSGTINIFAGPSYYDSFYQNFPNSQILKAGASDERGQLYFLESMQGFTRAKDAYFSGNNFFMQLDPGESSSATFVFEFSNMYSGSEPANFINVNVELAIVPSSQSKGTHRTRSLALTRQRLD